MKIRKLLILIVCIALAIVLLPYCGLRLWIELDDCYSPDKTYGNVTICTTKYEARIDDTNNNSGSTLVHNLALCGLFGSDLYIIDKNYNKMILNIYNRNLTNITNSVELSEVKKKNFDAVLSHQYDDYRYLYKK